MNPLIRHFLPSVIRGVYRFDNEFCSVRNDEDYAEYVTAKFQFLPANVREVVRAYVGPTEGFEAAKTRLELPDELLGSTATSSIRAFHFFKANESYFAEALQGEAAIANSAKFLEIQFVKRVLAPLLAEAGLRAITRQKEVGPFRVDFAIEGDTKYALETDGRSKFTSREDFDKFLSRQNYLISQGWRVYRYSHSQVIRSTAMTRQKLYRVLNGDPKLRRYLESPSAQSSLFGPAQPRLKRTSVEVVNWFYEVQDWFTEFVLARPGNYDTVPIQGDCTISHFPKRTFSR